MKTTPGVEGRPFSPKVPMGQRPSQWKDLVSDADAVFDTVVELTPKTKPQVSWGTSPEMVLAVDQNVPGPAAEMIQ